MSATDLITREPELRNRWRRWSLLLTAVFTLVIASRVIGPSDIYDRHQHRTVSYTADMLQHGRWLLPIDSEGIPATKPPLFNWLSVPFVKAFGFHDWTLRAPSIVAAAVTLFGLIWVAHRITGGREPSEVGPQDASASFPRHPRAGGDPRLQDADRVGSRPRSSRGQALRGNDGEGAFPPLTPGALTPTQRIDLAALAGLMWLAMQLTFALAYLARPDMLVTALLVVAWGAATVCLDPTTKHPLRWALLLWVMAGLAALAKGPVALFVPAYVIPASKLVYGRWSLLKRTGWWWGVPLMLAIFAAWALPAYLSNPGGFTEQMIEAETMKRVNRSASPLALITTSYKVPFYFFTRFMPWCVLTVLAIIHLVLERRRHTNFRGNMAPAWLWCIVVLGGFSLLFSKRADRFAPVFPAAAVLAAYWVIIAHGRHGVTIRRVAVIAVLLAIAWAVSVLAFSKHAQNRYGENILAFAAAVRTEADPHRTAFLGVNLTPLEALLGVNQPGHPTADQLAAAQWIVLPLDSKMPLPDAMPPLAPQPLLTSAPVWNVGGMPEGRLGLFRVISTAAADPSR